MLPGGEDGLIQGALGISTYVPNVVPSLNTIYSTIVFVDDPVAATALRLRLIRSTVLPVIEEFKKINFVALSGWTSRRISSPARAPIKSLADLKGKRVRATGGNTELMQIARRRAGGGHPCRGVWAAATRRAGLPVRRPFLAEDFGYADLAKHVTSTPLGLTGPAVAIWNRDMWNKMTPDQKKTSSASNVLCQRCDGDWLFVDENNQILEELKRPRASRSFRATTRASSSSPRSTTPISGRQHRERQEVRREGPRSDHRRLQQEPEEMGGISKEVGRDIDKFAAAIQREIYDKVDLSKL